jgi:flagellar export protein FliJ
MAVAHLLARRERQRLEDVLRAAGAVERRLAALDRQDRDDDAESGRQFAAADQHGLRQMPAYLAGLRARRTARAVERAALQAELEALRRRILLHHREAEKFETVDAAAREQERKARASKEQAVLSDLAVLSFAARRHQADRG